MLFSLLVAAAGLAAASPLVRRDIWPDPEPCTGNNSYVHDPAVIRRSDGTWFRLSTLGHIAIASAPSLGGPWTYLGPMLAGGSSINVVYNQQLWAPDVYDNGDGYTVHYAVSTGGSQDSEIGVATSADLTPGSWTDHGSAGVPKDSKYNLIDPNWFQKDKTTTPLLNFGSAWDGVFQTTVQADGQDWASGSAITNTVFNSTIPPGQPIPAIVEGSYMYWWPYEGVDYYYLFFSSGACCNAANALAPPGSEYKVMVCRSTSQSGPFTDATGKNCLTENGGTLVLGSHGAHVYAPGGQGVLFDSDAGKNVLYYHYVDPTIGYDYSQFLFGFNYLDFSSGWPVVTA